MVHRAIRHCCRSGSSRDTLTSHIWISDDVLATQWAVFAHSASMRATVSRPYGTTKLPPLKPSAKEHDARSSGYKHIGKKEVTYTSRRHGSAAPGPLEARKRRALQKHMTGATNLGMFGSGLDFSGSSWRNQVGIAGKGINTRRNTLYEALGMIWRWWLLDPDEAPVRHENIVTLGVGEYVPSDSFEELLRSLDTPWTQKPESIIELLEALSESKRPDQHELQQKVCSWITAEVTLGSMTEKNINRILWNLTQSTSSSSQSIHNLNQDLAICRSIAEGILRSTVRPVKDLHQDTVWLLLRTLALVRSDSKDYIDYISSALQSLAQHQPTQATKSLSDVLEVISRSNATMQSHVVGLLQSLPINISTQGILTFARSLMKDRKMRHFDSSMDRLKTFLDKVSTVGFFQHIREQSNLTPQRLRFEHELFRLDMIFVAAYLRSAHEIDVCKYVMNHVVRPVKGASTPSSKVNIDEAVDCKFLSLPPEQQTYASLLHTVEDYHPQKMRQTLRFILTFFRLTDCMSDCYKLNCYLFSKRDLRGRVSVEYFHKEIELWAEKRPLLALILLASDRRRGIMHHPVVAKVLAATTTEFERIPMDMCLHLATTLIETHGSNLKIAKLQKESQEYSTRILELLLEPIAWGRCNERQALRKAQEIVKLLASVSSEMRKESSVAITNIVAIKTLEARRKVPKWKLEWLAPIVTYLEGPEVWRDSLARIELWWRVLETEEDSHGRKWKDGVGWVRK